MKRKYLLISALLIAGLLITLLQWLSIMPQIGTLSNNLDKTRMADIESQFVRMEILIIKINRTIIQSGFTIDSRESMNQKWIELDRSWRALKQYPEKIVNHTKFSRALDGQLKSIQDFRPEVAKKTKYMALGGEEGTFLLYYVDSLADNTTDIQKFYRKHVKTTDLSGNGILWHALAVMLFIAAAVILIKSPRNGASSENQ